jgi:hypothetical protein
MTQRTLLKSNYNTMNNRFLAALVKIRGSKFTKRMRVMDLLWRVRGRIEFAVSVFVPVQSMSHAAPCVSHRLNHVPSA